MSWLADLKCGDPRCGCTGSPIRVVVHTSNYIGSPEPGIWYDPSGPTKIIYGDKIIRYATTGNPDSASDK